MRRYRLEGFAGLAVALCLAACSSSPTTAGSSGRLRVVAAENFWGSIAAQLGGDRVQVRSIISNPDTDPHDYEPTAGDGRTLASADYVIYNGIGYDPWAGKLIGANPKPGRRTLNVGTLVGIKPGGNPHRWYSPPDVSRVIDQITSDYERLAPKDTAYFEQQRNQFNSVALAGYHSLVTSIRTAFAGTPVGASESIFEPMATALGLDLRTPGSFLDAISEGGEPTAADKVLVDSQLRDHQIDVYVFNTQNSTPDVRAQVNEAKALGIPIVPITETLAPSSALFQDWQVAELQALKAALARGTGK
jgi:zinc/manganese transport system substrate-binding protein